MFGEQATSRIRSVRVRRRGPRNADRIASLLARHGRRHGGGDHPRQPAAARCRRAGLPSGLAKILERCLEKQPGRSAVLGSGSRALSRIDWRGAASKCDRGRPWRPRTFDGVAIASSRSPAACCWCFAVAPWVFARMMADRAVTAAIDADLARAERLVRRVQRERSGALSLTARLVASFPELKALFATDAATMRDYLTSYQQRNPGVPLLVALGARRQDHRAHRQRDVARPETTNGSARWSADAVSRSSSRSRDRPYHAAAAAVDAGGNLFGYVIGANADRRGVRRGAEGRDAGRSGAPVGTVGLASTLRRGPDAVALARRVARLRRRTRAFSQRHDRRAGVRRAGSAARRTSRRCRP